MIPTAVAAMVLVCGRCVALPDAGMAAQPAPATPTRAGPSADPDERLRNPPGPDSAAEASFEADAPRDWALPPLGPNDGRGFRNMTLPIGVFAGNIELIGRRVISWEEPEPTGPPTQRLILERDAALVIGDQVFDGDRIAVWLRPIGAGGVGRGEGIYQVFAVVDEAASVTGIAQRRGREEPEPSYVSLQALVATERPPRLRVDAVLDGPPRGGARAAISQEGESRLAALLEPLDNARRVAAGAPVVEPIETAEAAVEEGPRPIFTSDGVFFLSAGDRVVARPATEGEEGDPGLPEDVVQLFGDVVVQYSGAEGDLELTATRAVVFLKPGTISGGFNRFGKDSVEGLYLEGAVVATDGDYTLKCERAFYDVAANRAVVLDAVFSTYNASLRSPLYVRAEAVRQESADQFSAERANVSTTGFFEPHLSLGTREMTIERRAGEGVGGATQTVVDARNITLEANGVPFLWFPRFVGDPERIALRNIGYNDSDRTGPVITSSWSPFALFGIEEPEDFTGLIDIDVYTERGVGLGARGEWETDRRNGDFFGYMLPDDDGTDQLRAGRQIERDGDFRGFVQFRDRWQVNENWTLIAEGAHASDEAFPQVFLLDYGARAEEITNRLHLNRIEGDTSLTLEAKAASNDFLINENLQQSPGYAVDKLPEIGTRTIGRDLLPEIAPGLITLTSEAQFSSMRLRFTEVTGGALGARNDERSRLTLGVAEDQTLGDRDRALGLDEGIVNRVDTRQELSMAFDVGPIAINPFVTGRFTAYDDNFEDFSPDETDRYRFWGAAGVRLSTQLTRIDNSVQSEALDLYRIRHIVEPSVTLWTADTTVENNDLPVYDDDVEGLNQGEAIRIGLDQTWQTKRGGPGRWRDVDVLTLDAAYVNHNNTDQETTIGRFFDARPELSVPGEYFEVEAVWQTTDAVALVHETIYDIETSKPDRHSSGVIVDHGLGLRTRGDIRFLENQDVTYGSISGEYAPTEKYVFDARAVYNFDEDEFQRFTLTVFRRFPYVAVGFRISVDEIADDTSIGFTLRPPTGRGGRDGFGGTPRDRFGG